MADRRRVRVRVRVRVSFHDMSDHKAVSDRRSVQQLLLMGRPSLERTQSSWPFHQTHHQTGAAHVSCCFAAFLLSCVYRVCLSVCLYGCVCVCVCVDIACIGRVKRPAFHLSSRYSRRPTTWMYITIKVRHKSPVLDTPLQSASTDSWRWVCRCSSESNWCKHSVFCFSGDIEIWKQRDEYPTV